MAYIQSVYFCISAAILLSFIICGESRYEPTWESLDRRPLPGWFDQAKVGIFLHWGVFSVPSYGSAWFWYYWKHQGVKAYVDFMKKNYPPDFTYADFAPQFKAEFYDAKKWADIFKNSGAKYVVLVSKHHEGFTLWPSKHSWNWNAMDVGPKQDLVAPLASAVKAEGLHFGVYHSLYEWFNPLYLADKASGYKTQNFIRDKTMPELYELVNTYKPDIIWSDGQWEADSSYWNSTQFLAWLYNDSPVNKTVVVNDRWGKDTTCKHGGYFNCNDRFNPKVLQKKKWENAMTIDKTAWTYVRNKQLSDFLTMEELLKTMAETVSCGGNILINVGPTPDGRIVPIFEERLRQLGSWLKVNGEAIYATKPWSAQNDTKTPNVWYTSKPGTHGHTSVYAIVLDWPQGGLLTLGAPTPSPNTVVTLLGYPTPIKWQITGSSGIEIVVPAIPINKMPCLWSWVFKMMNLAK